MCGILGIVRSGVPPLGDRAAAPSSIRASRSSRAATSIRDGARINLPDSTLIAMRDRLAHRGPDGEGLWRSREGHVALAHRRLAVLDLSTGGAQPLVSADATCALTYNGELYNDLDLRQRLAQQGAEFPSACDTHTVIAALQHHGPGALASFRGMFALAFFDARTSTLLLARDPLGIKPLYYWLHEDAHGEELVFASEIPAILAHPACSPRPDLVSVSAYLSTIRTTLGPRTLFKDIRTLLPGQVLSVDLSDVSCGRLRITDLSDQINDRRAAPGGGSGAEGGCHFFDLATPARNRTSPHTAPFGALADAAVATRAALRDSVRAHLRADVPACVLLSGGLDSSIITAETMDALGETGGSIAGVAPGVLHTYCAGARMPSASPSDVRTIGDLDAARRVAEALSTSHHEAEITGAMFSERWAWMVDRLGVPLSTPNEVAINQVARVLRSQGHIVALSGEGADELFAGYDMPLGAAFEFERASLRDGLQRTPESRAAFQLESNAWISPTVKGTVLRPEIWSALERDAAAYASYTDSFTHAQCECERAGLTDSLDPHLRFQRSINLAGLLARLDTSMMLEGVEGRTPFADVCVAALADRVPMSMKFEPSAGSIASGQRGGPEHSKRVLRAAYARQANRERACSTNVTDVPAWVLERPKASFPLPFQAWMGEHAPLVRSSPWAREVFTPEVIDLVVTQHAEVWNVAWPVINLTLWARRWWA